MRLEKKPKCSFCQESLGDNFYWWWADKRGKGGELVHYVCALHAQETWDRVTKGLEKLQEQIRQ